MDRKADHRSEYVSGEIIAMDGASREHNRITLNIGSLRNVQLRDKSCEPFTSDLRVKGEKTGAYVFPDVVAGCKPLEFADCSLDILLKPVVIMEVLSPTTESDDRGWKFAHSRRIPTLNDYIMVSQYQPFIEHHTRQEDGKWVLSELSGLDAILHLPSIGCELPLAEIYAQVEFASKLFLQEDNANDHRS